jgi:hypothetical protein
VLFATSTLSGTKAHALAYDFARDETVLFGGREAGEASESGDSWTSVLPEHLLGNWGHTTYRVDVDPDTDYSLALRMDVGNPAYSEYRARVVTHDEDSGERTYYDLPVAGLGSASSIEVNTGSSSKLYLVVAAVPSTLDTPWDFHLYDYKIVRLPD